MTRRRGSCSGCVRILIVRAVENSDHGLDATRSPGRRFQLALRERHTELGGRFGVVGEWSLPLDYGESLAEYRSIRGGVALLDRSHCSRILLSGTDADDVLTAVFGEGIRHLEEGRAIRVARQAADGTIGDLALVARTGGISYLVMGEPGVRFATLAALDGAVRRGYDARVDDRTETTCMLGVTGPEAAHVVAAHMAEALPARLPALQVALFEFHGFRSLAIRTSATGEDGFEFMLSPAVMLHLLDTLMAAGAQPAGFTSQEMCRVEACIPAWTPDLEAGLTLAEAELDPFIETAGGPSAGPPMRALAALLLESGTVEAGTPIVSPDGPVGQIRTCVYSPLLDATAALGVLDTRHASPGTRLSVAGLGATVVAKPFLRRRAESQ